MTTLETVGLLVEQRTAVRFFTALSLSVSEHIYSLNPSEGFLREL